MQKTTEEVISLVLQAGDSTKFKTKNLSAGTIVGVCAYYTSLTGANDGFVRASIKDANGLEVSQMQSIQNYRDRETNYMGGKKPLPIDGGQEYTVTILATQACKATLLVDFIFIYETENQY